MTTPHCLQMISTISYLTKTRVHHMLERFDREAVAMWWTRKLYGVFS